MKGVFACFATAAATTIPAGYLSISGTSLSRETKTFVPEIVDAIKGMEIPGINQTLFWVEPIRFEDVTIGSYDTTIVDKKGAAGVEVNLHNMSNQVAHTKIFVRDLLGKLKCTGEIWASATGGSFKAINTLEVDQDGNGKVVTVSPAGGFDIGTAEVYHKMDQMGCEALAFVLGAVDNAVLALIGQQLQQQLVPVVAKLVDTPLDVALKFLEKPPPLGFGKETFSLDNSFVSVDYGNDRITHNNKGEFKSNAHPVESSLKPPALSKAHNRDFVMSFSDYVLNTLFESLYAEHIGESQVTIPGIKTLFDKQCPGCPIVIAVKFAEPLKQTFEKGKAAVTMKKAMMEVGALNNSQVLPLVTLRVDSVADVVFKLEQTKTNADIKATLSLDSFSCELLVSHIPIPIPLLDLDRDMKSLISSLLETLNTDIPALQIPVVGGIKLAKEEFVIADRELRLEADFVVAKKSALLLV